MEFSTLDFSTFDFSIFVFSIFGVSIFDFSTLDLSVLGSVLLGFSGVQLTDKIFLKYSFPIPATPPFPDVVTSLYSLTHVCVCLSVCSSVRS